MQINCKNHVISMDQLTEEFFIKNRQGKKIYSLVYLTRLIKTYI